MTNSDICTTMESSEHFDNDRDFHLIVSNKDTLSSSTPFSFCTELQNPIKLKGNWKVAVKKISFTPGQFIPAYADKHHWKSRFNRHTKR